MILDITNPAISDFYNQLFSKINNILIEFKNLIVNKIQCEIIVNFFTLNNKKHKNIINTYSKFHDK